MAVIFPRSYGKIFRTYVLFLQNVNKRCISHDRTNITKSLFAADIIFVTEDRPHDNFAREGDNLATVAKISLEEALLGTTVTVNTIDNRTIRVPITDIVWSVKADFGKMFPNVDM